MKESQYGESSYRRANGGPTGSARTKTEALAFMPWLTLARDVAALFTPVRPRPEFRQELHRSLVAQARQRQAQQLLALPMPAPVMPLYGDPGLTERVMDWLHQEAEMMQYERRWVISAAAVGSAVSLAGILAYMFTRRRPAA